MTGLDPGTGIKLPHPASTSVVMSPTVSWADFLFPVLVAPALGFFFRVCCMFHCRGCSHGERCLSAQRPPSARGAESNRTLSILAEAPCRWECPRLAGRLDQAIANGGNGGSFV